MSLAGLAPLVDKLSEAERRAILEHALALNRSCLNLAWVCGAFGVIVVVVSLWFYAS